MDLGIDRQRIMARQVQAVRLRSEIDVVVFVLGGPIAGQGVLDADTGGPALCDRDFAAMGSPSASLMLTLVWAQATPAVT